MKNEQEQPGFPETKAQVVAKEVQRIAQKYNETIVLPEQLVEESRPKGSALHDEFEWDNKVCGDRYRIDQARRLLRMVVYMIPQRNEPVRALIHLSSDFNGGYRPIHMVMASEPLRAVMLRDALRDMEIFRRKYALLVELAGVFLQMDNAKKAVEAIAA